MEDSVSLPLIISALLVETERKISARVDLQFLDITVGEPAEIRKLLRTVLEHFYRNGDSELFAQNGVACGTEVNYGGKSLKTAD